MALFGVTNSMNKVLYILFSVLIVFGFSYPVFYAGASAVCPTDTYCFLAPLPQSATNGEFCDNPVNGVCLELKNDFKLGDYVNGIFKIGIALAGALAVIMFVIGGITYMVSAVVGQKQAAKDMMLNAILGLLLALGSYALLYTINTSLIKFNVIDDSTSSGGGSSGGGGAGGTWEEEGTGGCADGTVNLGEQEIYVEGTASTAVLCALSNMTSGGDESTNNGNPYYIEGANGKAIVAASVSQVWKNLIDAAAADGVTLTANSSFRTNAHQQVLWDNNPNPQFVAHPGYSNHQIGSAIDFGGIHVPSAGATCANGRATSPNDSMWVWLKAHASSYGVKQLATESWHWDMSNNTNRCP